MENNIGPERQGQQEKISMTQEFLRIVQEKGFKHRNTRYEITEEGMRLISIEFYAPQ